MAKFRVKPGSGVTGLINGKDWPPEGEDFEASDLGLTDEHAAEMSFLEPVGKQEKRPASKQGEEKR